MLKLLLIAIPLVCMPWLHILNATSRRLATFAAVASVISAASGFALSVIEHKRQNDAQNKQIGEIEQRIKALEREI